MYLCHNWVEERLSRWKVFNVFPLVLDSSFLKLWKLKLLSLNKTRGGFLWFVQELNKHLTKVLPVMLECTEGFNRSVTSDPSRRISNILNGHKWIIDAFEEQLIKLLRRETPTTRATILSPHKYTYHNKNLLTSLLLRPAVWHDDLTSLNRSIYKLVSEPLEQTAVFLQRAFPPPPVGGRRRCQSARRKTSEYQTQDGCRLLSICKNNRKAAVIGAQGKEAETVF